MSSAEKAERFAAYLVEYQSRVFGYIFAFVQNMADTSDIFQQTSVILWRKFDDFQPGTSFYAWATETARREVLHFLRSQSRSRVRFDDDLIAALAETHAQLDSEEGEHEEYLKSLAHCMDLLPDDDRRLISQCYAEDSRINAVATTYGRSSQSICNSLKRIRRGLLLCIQRTLTAGGVHD